MIICPTCENEGAGAVGPDVSNSGGEATCRTCGHVDEPNAFNTASNYILTQLVVELAERVAALESDRLTPVREHIANASGLLCDAEGDGN